MERLNTFSDETRNQFQHTFGWLQQWACSRTYGLGSILPWDKQFLIESLSDSTIYMALYTISHLLQGDGVFQGSVVGPAGITPDQLSPEVFDYIFLNKEYPSTTSISEEILQKLRREFEYWYPFDLRVSGKDLVPNHLTFLLYNHVAIWDHDESKWPLGIRGNGHLLLNKQKMSKQTGNFLTISDSCELFGADATRIALAHAGDSMADANFSSDNANKAVLDLFNGYQWAKEILESNSLQEREYNSVDRTFDSIMNDFIQKTDEAYERLHFREALVFCFYELRSARDAYRLRIGNENMNKALIERFIEVQALMMTPIAPHWSEQIWKLLNRDGFIVHALFPSPGEIDSLLMKQDAYFTKLRDDFSKTVNSTKKRKEVEAGIIYVATDYPEWHSKTVNILEQLYNEGNGSIDSKKALGKLKADSQIKKHMKLAVPLVKKIADLVETEGKSALDLKPPFNEKAFLEENKDFLESYLGLPLSIVDEDGSQKISAVPLAPTLYFS